MTDNERVDYAQKVQRYTGFVNDEVLRMLSRSNREKADAQLRRLAQKLREAIDITCDTDYEDEE